MLTFGKLVHKLQTCHVIRGQISLMEKNGLGNVKTESKDSTFGILQMSAPTSSSLKLDSSAPLFPHIPGLFYVLHLLYQELQLNELQRETAASLVCLLQQLAR